MLPGQFLWGSNLLMQEVGKNQTNKLVSRIEVLSERCGLILGGDQNQMATLQE